MVLDVVTRDRCDHFVLRLVVVPTVNLSLVVVPTVVGDAKSYARVDFHVEATSTFKVVEPKLTIEAEGPSSVLVGNQAVFNLKIKNPGSGKTTNIRMKAFLPGGLIAIAAGT